MEYKITNIKISVKCKNICLDTVKKFLCDSSIPFKKYNNYIVTKAKYTYIIFKKNIKNVDNIFHVNITNIPSLEYLSEAINTLKKFDKNTTTISYSVDNITVSKDFKHSIDIKNLLSYIPTDIKTTYNSETFPGVFMKFPHKIGTAILFHTGKCVFLGCRTVDNIETILTKLINIIQWTNADIYIR
jgi:TATA-box binding protein (TBP) (component of TFIID and TFIIIB)